MGKGRSSTSQVVGVDLVAKLTGSPLPTSVSLIAEQAQGAVGAASPSLCLQQPWAFL